jgi:hypothetical protein
LTTRIETMPIVDAPPVIRLYEAIGLFWPTGAPPMPTDATVATTECLLCRSHSHLPPARLGFISAGGDQRIFVVCADCNTDDTELEAKIMARVTEPQPTAHISPPPAAVVDVAPAKQGAWTARRDWVAAAAR